MDKTELELAEVPESLRPGIGEWCEQAGELRELGDLLETEAGIRAVLPRVLACSGYAADMLGRYPDLLPGLVVPGRLSRSMTAGDRAAMSGPLPAGETDALRELRKRRHRELLRIIWRDLDGAAGFRETLADLSIVADASICAALTWARTELAARYGQPHSAGSEPAELAVLAMGKLGGRELNFSSDIDLVFVYSERGDTDGARKISNEEYFRLLVQRVVDLLSRKTADGFVYRVDVRLRPFGNSGPLAVSLASLESYLMEHGRDWERYAYVKARVVNDVSFEQSLFHEVLRPFIYRRYLDYGVFSSLREMKALIEAEVRRREFRDNIKLGPGGIREIEFIVQSLQLVRGGTIAELQERELLEVLPRLVRHECLPEPVAGELLEAYGFLRLLENRLQAIGDRQTHDLPDREIDRARLAFAMGHEWEALAAKLAAQREKVSGHFRNIVFRTADDDEDNGRPLSRSWSDGTDWERLEIELEAMGYGDAGALARRLEAIRTKGLYSRSDETGRQRLDRLVPAVIETAAGVERADRALEGTLTVLEAIGRRSAYFALLNENPPALERLVDLCAKSDFLVRQISTHPLLLDELLDQRIYADPPDREELEADLAGRLALVAPDDTERCLDVLKNFQQAATFRVAVADFGGSLPLMRVSDRLTDIAELVLQSATDVSRAALEAEHGTPQCTVDGRVRDVGFAIIGYGKLGGLELGYGSDLDLVFLNDSEGEHERTGGDKSLENAVFFSRLTRRIIHMLTIPTLSGRLYEVDTRLRPSGRAGLLVSSLAAFERYQREDAWTWEHQALLRSRAVAGHPAVMSAFEQLRVRVLTKYVRQDKLAADVAGMRARMRDELCRGTGELFDIKQDRGGIADIEFFVQYLVLRDARRHPGLVRWSDNIRQLDALVEHNILSADDAEALAECYRSYRQRMHRLALAGQPAIVPRPEMREMASIVTTLWDEVFG